jgi:hypothetical protein
MKDFLLLFRKPDVDVSSFEPEAINAYIKKWNDWVDEKVAEGRVLGNGSRLTNEGKVLKPGGVITDGPFVEIKEKLGGFAIVKAESLDDATTLAHGCPILDVGGSVEIRQIVE